MMLPVAFCKSLEREHLTPRPASGRWDAIKKIETVGPQPYVLFFRGDNLILDKAKHFGMRLGPVGPPAGSILGDGHRNI